MIINNIKRKKDLEIILENLLKYENPKVHLEQYETNSYIVASIVWNAYMRGEIENSYVLDLGCGTGRFAIACALMNAKYVIGIDIDIEAIKVAIKNAKKLKVYSKVDFIVGNVEKFNLRKKFNITFQNPPFGIQSRKGIDIKFLEIACKLSNVIYSIHKSETINYVVSKVTSWNCKIDIVYTTVIDIPLMYKHHRKYHHKVNVTIIRVESNLR